MAYWGYYRPANPKQLKDGIKAKSQRGKFGSQWWSQRWIGLLESYGWDNRLQRGRSYARRGQVIDLKIEKGQVRSRVQGTRSTPYRVCIEVQVLTAKQWDQVVDAMAEQAIFAAKLLAGEMPEDIEDAFQAAGIRLFPSRGELNTDCSCPDWANPCKHIAAVYYLLGERFDEDPFFIFLLRGLAKDELMEALRKRRVTGLSEAAGAETSPEEPPELSTQSFWKWKEALTELKLEPHPPQVEVAPLKRLGDPPFWSPRRKPFQDHLLRFYRQMSAKVKED